MEPIYKGNLTENEKALAPYWMTETNQLFWKGIQFRLRLLRRAINIVNTANTKKRKAEILNLGSDLNLKYPLAKEGFQDQVINDWYLQKFYNVKASKVNTNWNATYRDIVDAALLIAYDEYKSHN